MRLRHPPFGLVAAALLVGLVGLLATLQYQWLGKVSEAEREQLRRSLDQHAREFADDFDGELGRLYLSVQLSGDAGPAGDWTRFAAAYDRWRSTSRFPQMVRAVYLLEGPGDRPALRPYDPSARSFGAPLAAWPAHLEAARAQLAPPTLPPAGNPGGARILAVAFASVLPEIPALLVPITSPQQADEGSKQLEGSRQLGVSMGAPRLHLLVDLDRAVLRDAVIPALVARHFPDRGAQSERVAVLASSGQRVFARGFEPGPVEAAAADIVVPFFGVRLDTLRNLVPRVAEILGSAASGPATVAGDVLFAQPDKRVAVMVEQRAAAGPGKTGTAVSSAQVRIVRGGWRLVLRHAAGSVDTAVSQARRRNLWLSFGILGVLAAGVILVLENARRRGQLAAQQMDFVTTVSHELRTPLAVIRSAAQNLSAGVVSEPDHARRYGALIEEEGRRLTEMVEQVLEYARLRGAVRLRDPRPVDVAALVADVARSCQPLCEAGAVRLEVKREEAAGTTMVSGEEPALRRLLQNLIANALKHAASGGWIGVTVATRTGRRGPDVVVMVEDRGPGIEAPDLAHIFEPFYRGRRAVDGQIHGNGLGLSLVKHIAEAHGGTVGARSTPVGTTFTLRLPGLAAGRTVAQMADSALDGASPDRQST